MAALVLPSALNVPTANPTQTLEFAPVPPSQDQPNPPVGNTSSLSLGSSAGPAADAPGGGAAPTETPEAPDGPGTPPLPGVPGPDGEGERPVTKRCVGNPPRQTEDPMSPPCVAHFEGDNFGETFRGVTADEIRVLFYMHGDRCEGATSRGFECPQKGVVHDLSDPPSEDDHSSIRFLRAYLTYFNNRYQTYGRKVHGFVYYDTGTAQSPATAESRVADAIELTQDIQPFAVLPYAITFNDEFLRTVADRGYLNFGSFGTKQEAFYAKYAGRIWSYPASIEKQAEGFASFVCAKVAGHDTSFSGQEGQNGQPRRFGLLTTDDDRKASFVTFGKIATKLLEDCGIEFVARGTYPQAGTVFDTENQSVAAQNIATFVANDVTTVIRMQGVETAHSRAAGSAGYRPEWILAGDGQTEGFTITDFQDKSVWDRHAWVVGGTPLAKAPNERQCYQSLSEADPEMPAMDKSWVCNSRSYYEDLRLLYTGIQVAGPKLTPETIDKGLHAIPAVRSTDPSVPACYFEPGDYTCVKDATAAWFDGEKRRTSNVQGREQEEQPGCWRMARGGARYFPGSWPKGDVLNMQSEDDPCNRFAGSATQS